MPSRTNDTLAGFLWKTVLACVCHPGRSIDQQVGGANGHGLCISGDQPNTVAPALRHALAADMPIAAVEALPGFAREAADPHERAWLRLGHRVRRWESDGSPPNDK